MRIEKILFGLVLALALTGCIPSAAKPSMFSESLEAKETTSAIEIDIDALIVDGYHLEQSGELDGENSIYQLNITLPWLQENLPYAEEVNKQIGEDFYYAYYDSAKSLEDYLHEGGWGHIVSPVVHIWYEAYLFEDLCEIVIKEESYSLEGSGINYMNHVYCYDVRQEKACSIEDLMAYLSLSKEEIIKACNEEHFTDFTVEDLKISSRTFTSMKMEKQKYSFPCNGVYDERL